MKKILSLSLLLTLANVFYSQGTLQFNQVLAISSTTQTVPGSKVWKIESYLQATVARANGWISYTVTSPTTGQCTGGDLKPMYINGNAYYSMTSSIASGSGGSYYADNALVNFPIWLPAGSTVRTMCSNDLISVIEFNVVP